MAFEMQNLVPLAHQAIRLNVVVGSGGDTMIEASVDETDAYEFACALVRMGFEMTTSKGRFSGFMLKSEHNPPGMRIAVSMTTTSRRRERV